MDGETPFGSLLPNQHTRATSRGSPIHPSGLVTGTKGAVLHEITPTLYPSCCVRTKRHRLNQATHLNVQPTESTQFFNQPLGAAINHETKRSAAAPVLL